VALALSVVWASVVWVFIRGLGRVAKPVSPVIFGVAPFCRLSWSLAGFLVTSRVAR
jgi:hypothetical protein